MNADEAVKEVNRLWEYKSDGMIDDWNFTVHGDCEDYALSVLKRIFGGKTEAKRALLNREAFIWYTTTNKGDKHAVLEYQGRFVCNRIKRWQTDKDKMLIDKWHFRFPRAFLIIKLGLSEII